MGASSETPHSTLPLSNYFIDYEIGFWSAYEACKPEKLSLFVASKAFWEVIESAAEYSFDFTIKQKTI